jgi:two-component system response regulator YesN
VIAEDEDLIRRGLERELPWSALGMRVVGLAADGLEAVRLCAQVRPDILLTDIRMPHLDGLALIERVREESPDTVFLIISGYNDFSYAQEAISLGVSHYFLKPLELDRIEEKLREVASRILEHRRQSEDRRLSNGFVADVLPFVRRQFFLELLYSPEGDGVVARQLAERGAVQESTCCAAILVQVGIGSQPQSSIALERGLGRTLGSRPWGCPDIYLLRRVGDEAQCAVVLLGPDAEELAARRDSCLADLRGLAFVRGAAGGSIRRSLAGLHLSYSEARKDLLLQALLARGRPVAGALPQAAEKEQPAPDLSETGREAARVLDAIEKAAAEGDLAGLEELLDRLEVSLPGPASPPATRTAAIVALFDALDRVGTPRGIHLEDSFACRDQGGTPATDENALRVVFAALTAAAREAASMHATRREFPARQLIDKARRYIESRSSSWDLTLEDVAAHVELNPSYFSTLFKSVTQVNYIDYLTGLRMEKARELLERSRIKIAAVARMVGFQSPGYFGYLFKKHFGATPSRFRSGREAAGGSREQ